MAPATRSASLTYCAIRKAVEDKKVKPMAREGKDAEEEHMEGGIHVVTAARVGTGEDMECCQTNEGARRSDLGNCSGATRQRSWKRSRGEKKKANQASVMNETFLAMTDVCKVRTKHTLAKMDASQPSWEGSSRPPENSNAHYPSIRECIEICKRYGTPETHGHKFLEAAQQFEHEWWHKAFLALPD
ncbi:hypothetical protein CJ030_MR8G023387 [Morella rubra]|uniref:Uncharacterized protein n=1 Tax=Morella rubra TaxID=262757 RepID=A0A6A1UTB9_9ROSI|nr:hypothetical protein CJ030_MR8G023387 [Morella rubra]